MNPEHLKKIAEFLGYEEVRINSDGKTHGYPKSFCYRVTFDPLNSAGQLLDIIEKLNIKTWWNEEEKLRKAFVPSQNKSINTGFGFGKTIQEAVMNAAILYIESEES